MKQEGVHIDPVVVLKIIDILNSIKEQEEHVEKIISILLNQLFCWLTNNGYK